MKLVLQIPLKQTILIFCFFVGFQIENLYSENFFYNDPPEAICYVGQVLVDQNHDLTFGGQGAIFNFNNEGLSYPGQTVTIGTTGLLTRVDTEFGPNNITFGGTVILTIVDGGNPNPPQTILATKTVVPNSVNVIFELNTPISVTAGQQITLLFSGTLETASGVVSEPNDTDSYPGGDRWATNNGGLSWFGPFNEDIDFITYVSFLETASIEPGGSVTIDPSLIDSGSRDDITDLADLLLNVSPSTFDCNDLGNQIVTLSVEDESGLRSSCTARVVINDDNNNCCDYPDAFCSNIVVQLDANGNASISPEDVDAGSTTPCGLDSKSLDADFFDCTMLGPNLVTLTVTDVNGYYDSCIAQVTVNGLPCDWSAGPDGVNCSGGSAANYDPISEVFTITSEGCYNPSFYRPTDSHGFGSIQICGDGEIIAQVGGVLGNGWAGISMREGDGPSDKMIQLMIDGSFLTRRELRQTTGGIAYAHVFPTQGKNWLRLTRTGNTFSAYRSADGNNWSLVIMTNINMFDCYDVGLVTMNGSPTGSLTGVFEEAEVAGTIATLTMPTPPEVTVATSTSPDFTVYPNPTSGIINLRLDSLHGKSFSLKVYNNLGQNIYANTYDHLDHSQERLDLSTHNNGIYFIDIELSDGTRINKKLVIEKRFGQSF